MSKMDCNNDDKVNVLFFVEISLKSTLIQKKLVLKCIIYRLTLTRDSFFYGSSNHIRSRHRHYYYPGLCSSCGQQRYTRGKNCKITKKRSILFGNANNNMIIFTNLYNNLINVILNILFNWCFNF